MERQVIGLETARHLVKSGFRATTATSTKTTIIITEENKARKRRELLMFFLYFTRICSNDEKALAEKGCGQCDDRLPSSAPRQPWHHGGVTRVSTVHVAWVMRLEALSFLTNYLC